MLILIATHLLRFLFLFSFIVATSYWALRYKRNGKYIEKKKENIFTSYTTTSTSAKYIVGDRVRIEIPDDDPETLLKCYNPDYNHKNGFIVDSTETQLKYEYQVLLESGGTVAWIKEENIVLVKKGLTGKNRRLYIRWSSK